MTDLHGLCFQNSYLCAIAGGSLYVFQCNDIMANHNSGCLLTSLKGTAPQNGSFRSEIYLAYAKGKIHLRDIEAKNYP